MSSPASTDANDAEERILTAALETFAEQGFDGSKLRDIASNAGVTLGLVQYYFGDKLKLWRAAVDRAFADMRVGLEGILLAPGVGDDRERLRAVLRGHVAFVAERPEFVRLMHEEGKRRGPRMRWLVDRHVKPLYQLLIPLIERVQAAGQLPDGIPAVHFVYIVAGASGVIFHQAEECQRVSGLDPFTPVAVANHARAVELLLLGPAPTENDR